MNGPLQIFKIYLDSKSFIVFYNSSCVSVVKVRSCKCSIKIFIITLKITIMNPNPILPGIIAEEVGVMVGDAEVVDRRR